MVNPDRVRPYEDIADRLRVLRSIEGMEQREFASAASVGYSQYKNWESGAHRLSLDGALNIRKRFGATLEYLYLGDVDSLPRVLRSEVISISDVKS